MIDVGDEAEAFDDLAPLVLQGFEPQGVIPKSGRNEAVSGSMMRLVMILKPTPMEAVMPSSRIIRMGMMTRVMKPTKAVTRARVPE